jgi:hypothetical protein
LTNLFITYKAATAWLSQRQRLPVKMFFFALTEVLIFVTYESTPEPFWLHALLPQKSESS